jgi:hypothetical protein
MRIQKPEIAKVRFQQVTTYQGKHQRTLLHVCVEEITTQSLTHPQLALLVDLHSHIATIEQQSNVKHKRVPLESVSSD